MSVRFLSVIYLFLRLRFVMYLSQILMSGTNSGKAVGLSRNFFHREVPRVISLS